MENTKNETPKRNLDDRRRRDLSMIHLARRQLGIDDANYRVILETVAGIASAAALDADSRRRVIDYFKALGFRPVHKSAKASGMHLPACEDRAPQLSKIGACLADMGLPWSYADGIAKQMFRVEFVKWLQPWQLQKVVASLASHQKRRRAKEAR